MDSEELRRTPLYDEHKALGARLVPFAGWQMPVQYKTGTYDGIDVKGGVTEEHRAVRTAAGLFDVSHMGELEINGADALNALNRLITNDLARLVDGQAQYTCCCNAEGTILDDLIVYRRSETSWLVVCNASNREKIVSHFARELGDGNTLEDVSDRTALIALQGPKALAIADLLGDHDLSALKTFRFQTAKLGGIEVTAARTGYTGEDGLELFCGWDDAAALWKKLLTAGSSNGINPAGLGARDTLRLEARLSLYGNDIDETTNPLEAGLAWTVKLDKSDFIGRDALLKIKDAGLTRKIVGFEMVGKGIARQGYPIHKSADEEAIGITTSGSPGPTVGKNIALGYVPVALAEIGTPLVIDCRGRKTEAVVVKTPFYKRAG